MEEFYNTKLKKFVTTKELLDDTFKEFWKEKIVAKADFMCCQTCGSSAIEDYKENDSIGYVFYHKQDMEDLIKNGGTYMSFDSFDKEDSKKVGIIIRDHLKKYGLKVEWSGDSKHRIYAYQNNHLEEE